MTTAKAAVSTPNQTVSASGRFQKRMNSYPVDFGFAERLTASLN
jgi:hypothetical protein